MSEFNKLELPSYFEDYTRHCLEFLEQVRDAGYSAANTNAIIDSLNRVGSNAGAINTILWMLYDGGYIFGWYVTINKVRQHVWSSEDVEPTSLDEVYCE